MTWTRYEMFDHLLRGAFLVSFISASLPKLLLRKHNSLTHPWLSQTHTHSLCQRTRNLERTHTFAVPGWITIIHGDKSNERATIIWETSCASSRGYEACFARARARACVRSMECWRLIKGVGIRKKFYTAKTSRCSTDILPFAPSVSASKTELRISL